MKTENFEIHTNLEHIEKGEILVNSPSNIALVKYWGKLENQIPANASISYTLSNCKTTTSLKFEKHTRLQKDFKVEVWVDGIETPSFLPKILTFFKRIEQYCPYLKDYAFRIDTSNSFPHSSGIASSASGMSAIAKALVELEALLGNDLSIGKQLEKASFLARLGSGSASRSVYPKLVVWGNHPEIPNSSDLIAVPYPHKVAENLLNFNDTILLIDKGEKQVSSTVGHNLMHNHPYAARRFEQANENLTALIPILEKGDLWAFGELIESEALTLHGMMMTSMPYFILIKPNTLEVIQKVWKFRKEQKIPLFFTLDAGANVHLLYPDEAKEKAVYFIENELSKHCKDGEFIHDKVQL